MGKKDASRSSLQGLPVDSYRKQIGKHDMKKEKKAAKARKMEMEAKSSAMTIKDVLLIMVAILAVVVAVYLIFYAYISSDRGEDAL